MHLASPPLYKLKYIPENYTFIDVTLGGENIQFHDWKVWEDSLSDHPYIFFQVIINAGLAGCYLTPFTFYLYTFLVGGVIGSTLTMRAMIQR